MPECSYCGETVESEDAHLRHLRDEHEGELGSIDQRRVADFEGSDGGLPTGPIVLGAVILIAIGVVLYVILFVGDGGGDGPGAFGSAHEHGTIEMVVLGERVDFSQPEYQTVVDRFHFEGGNGRIWHVHAEGVTLKWAMDTLPGIEITADSVTFQGTTYRDSDPNTEVIVEVNGEPVDPASYELQGTSVGQVENGDHVRIVVRRTNGTG